jgi:hypothetical protein
MPAWAPEISKDNKLLATRLPPVRPSGGYRAPTHDQAWPTSLTLLGSEFPQRIPLYYACHHTFKLTLTGVYLHADDLRMLAFYLTYRQTPHICLYHHSCLYVK